MLIIKYIYLLFRTMESSFQAITVFILSSLMALTVLHHFMKARWERVWCALCAVPLLTFLVFYYHNRIIGMPELTLQRRTEAIKKFFGTPADNENFHACMISDGVGYLRITEESYKNDPPLDVIKDCLDGYSKELYAELDGKLNSLSGQGMKQLIIDLRNNDGGYSSLTRSVVALFSDQPLPSDMGYYLNGSYHSLFPVKTYGTGPWKDLPLIVLVNGDTGSSGDILAYYLQTYANATLIGDSTTWGCAQCTESLKKMSHGDVSTDTFP